jgi:hypothetical protein
MEADHSTPFNNVCNTTRFLSNTSKNLIRKSAKFPHHNIHKYTEVLLMERHKQSDHILRVKGWHSLMSDHSEELTVLVTLIRWLHKFDMERFNVVVKE